MALSFFEEIESTSGNGDKLFCKEFLEKNPKENGKQFSIKEIKLVKSGKGFLLETDYFMCWIWRKSKIAGYLIEALELYISSGEGYALFAVADKTHKDGFNLAMDPEIQTYWYDLGKQSYSTLKPSSTETNGGNPFLPAALSPTIADPTPLIAVNGKVGVGAAVAKKLRGASQPQ